MNRTHLKEYLPAVLRALVRKNNNSLRSYLRAIEMLFYVQTDMIGGYPLPLDQPARRVGSADVIQLLFDLRDIFLDNFSQSRVNGSEFLIRYFVVIPLCLCGC